MAESIPSLVEEIKKLETQLEHLEQEKSNVDAEAPVDLFLQRVLEAMGV